MKKAFDCVEMKHKAQERIYEETRNLSRKDELAYWDEAARRFWQEINLLKGARKRKVASRKRRPG